MSFPSACTSTNHLCGPLTPFFIHKTNGLPGDCQFDAVRMIVNSDPRYEKVDILELRRECATRVLTSMDHTQLRVARNVFLEDHRGEHWIQKMPRNLNLEQFRLYWAKSLIMNGDHWGEEISLVHLSLITNVRFLVIDKNCNLKFATDSPIPQCPVGILRLENLHYEPIFTTVDSANTKQFLFEYNSHCIKDVLGRARNEK